MQSRRIFLAGAAAAAVPFTPRPSRAAGATVNVGSIAADAPAVVNYTLEQGFFRNAGLNVDIQLLSSGPAIASAVIGGTLDVGVTNVSTIASARARGVPLKFIAPAQIVSERPDGDIIMVAKDAMFQNGTDWNGKTVGVIALRTTQQASIMAYIDKRGGDSKTVKFVEIPFPQMAGAIDQKRIDAGAMTEPFTAQALPTHRSVGSIYEALPRPLMILGFFATETWLQNNADAAARFVTTLRQGAVWANAHKSETLPMLERLTHADPAIAAKMSRVTYGTTFEVATIQPIIDVVVKYGFLEKSVDTQDLLWRSRSGA